MRKSVFVMGDKNFLRLKRRYGEVVCRFCGKPIVVGERFLSKSRGSLPHLYHVGCWDSLFLDV